MMTLLLHPILSGQSHQSLYRYICKDILLLELCCKFPRLYDNCITYLNIYVAIVFHKQVRIENMTVWKASFLEFNYPDYGFHLKKFLYQII